MHIGLIVGIGPAATDYYYRSLIAAAARAGKDLELTMAHADTPYPAAESDRRKRPGSSRHLRLTERLLRAGIDQIAVTSIAGHFCIDAFKAASPVPVVDLLEVVQLEVKQRGLRRAGLLGTRVVMESRFYGVLDGVEVIAPADDLMEVHDAYVAMASAGVATPAHREVFVRAGMSLTRTHGCESIMLAGTDLALVFGKGVESGFNVLDCAEAHAVAIANAALTGQDGSGSTVHARPSAFSRR